MGLNIEFYSLDRNFMIVLFLKFQIVLICWLSLGAEGLECSCRDGC